MQAEPGATRGEEVQGQEAASQAKGALRPACMTAAALGEQQYMYWPSRTKKAMRCTEQLAPHPLLKRKQHPSYYLYLRLLHDAQPFKTVRRSPWPGEAFSCTRVHDTVVHDTVVHDTGLGTTKSSSSTPAPLSHPNAQQQALRLQRCIMMH